MNKYNPEKIASRKAGRSWAKKMAMLFSIHREIKNKRQNSFDNEAEIS